MFQLQKRIKRNTIILIGLLFPMLGIAQQFNLVTNLSDSVHETSGLAYINNKLVTLNDSGGEPALYELDSITGNVTRKILISNATNYDWEDMCTDDSYIYIADMGNNNGNRVNLKIYRVLISDYLNNNSVTAQVISFKYSDQTNYVSNPYAHNFDAEALISFNDSLYIFTKNWADQKTKIYPVSKIPGDYELTAIDSFDSQGLITGGTYNLLSGMIVLSGYTLSSPFIIELSGFSTSLFSDGNINRYEVSPPTGYSIQMEAVVDINANEYFLSTEKNSDLAGLYKLKTNNPLGVKFINQTHDSIYPNPTSGTVIINYPNAKTVDLYDINGHYITTYSSKEINTSNHPKGGYILVIRNEEGQVIASKKLIIE